jgi:GT2 family glycosyltransferase
LTEEVRTASSKLDAPQNACREITSEEKPLVSIVVTTRNRVRSLIRCVASVYSNDYAPIEVIVVDDNSSEDVTKEVKNRFPSAKIIVNTERRLLAASRNSGFKGSSGSYILFVDDDNVLDGSAIGPLVQVFTNVDHVGVAAPLAHYYGEPSRLWWAGARAGKLTGIVTFPFRGRLDVNLQKPYLTDQFHNVFMVTREVFDLTGGFDERLFPIYLSEADFAERMKKIGYKALVVPGSRVFHDVPVDLRRTSLRDMHITEPIRAYYVARNRIVYMRLHRSTSEFLAFLFLFEPLIVITHLVSILLAANARRPSLLESYVRGVLDGFALREIRR